MESQRKKRTEASELQDGKISIGSAMMKTNQIFLHFVVPLLFSYISICHSILFPNLPVVIFYFIFVLLSLSVVFPIPGFWFPTNILYSTKSSFFLQQFRLILHFGDNSPANQMFFCSFKFLQEPLFFRPLKKKT